MIITRSDIFLHILFTSIHVSVCVCLLIRWSISTFVYLCDCGKFPLPSPSVAFVRKHGDWQSAFSMIYTFAQVESSVWISFNKLLNSRLAKKYFDTRRHFDETQENWLRQNFFPPKKLFNRPASCQILCSIEIREDQNT